MPEPQLEAPPEALDQPLFAPSAAAPGEAVASIAAPRLAWLGVVPVSASEVTLVNGQLLGASPGSSWSIYPPGENQFRAGRALAVATVTQVIGRDARATLGRQGAAIAAGSRAVALMPAPATTRIAIRLLDVPADRRSRVEESLRRGIRDVVFVGPGEAARFLVDLQGPLVRLLSADGLHVVGSFALNDERAAASVARIVSRSAGAAELLSFDNPSSQLRVAVRVGGAGPIATRDIRLATETAPARMHSRRDGEARSAQNSLQLSLSVNADAYITIVDVDSEGSMNVLFPNDYQQRTFYPDGAVRAGELVTIPDSLQTGNRAGFHWDYSPPRGTDTVRVFASTDLATATLIRQHIKSLQQATGQGRSDPQQRGLAADFDGLRADLRQLATRGIKTVADPVAAPTAATFASDDWSATSVTIEVDD
jgi:hypothetical protein